MKLKPSVGEQATTMALRKDGKKEEASARELPRRATARNKTKTAIEDGPATAAAIVPPKRKSRRASTLKTDIQKDECNTNGRGKRSSLLGQVNVIMGSSSEEITPKTSKARSSVCQRKAEENSDSVPTPVQKLGKKTKKLEPKISPSPSSSPPASPSKPRRKSKGNKQRAVSPSADSTMNFLQSLEQANASRKQKTKKKNKKLKKNLSQSRKDDIQKELVKRKELKAQRKAITASLVKDDTIEEIGWFSMTIKENNTNNDTASVEEANESKTKKKKEKKQLRSTVDYSWGYPFTTRQDMEEKAPGYYLHMIGIKRRQFHIENLFTTRAVVPRVYYFDWDIIQDVLDKKEDKWWIKSRLQLYQEDKEEEGVEEEIGMEVLGVFFGPNEIDHNQDQDDSSVIFSIATVESVQFSDDDDNQEFYKGKLREKVEVMPGEFKMIRREEETYDAIENGNYMSSLCLGCGVALVSVQDAREVACPTCGSITPLNGVSLQKPFGIATGIKRVKVEHLLAPRRSIFVASEELISVPTAVITANNNQTIADRQDRKGQRQMKCRVSSGKSPSSGRSTKVSSPRKQDTPNMNAKGKSRPDKPATKPGAVQVASR